MKRNALASAVAALLVTSVPAFADINLHVFKAGEPARAADVNGNFTALKNAILAVQADNDALKSQVKDLKAALAAEISLQDVITVETVNGIRTVRLTGVNLQVVNGTNSTETVNGSGNVIIGYDEPNTGTRIGCSLALDANGTVLGTQGECLAAGGTVIAKQKTGSHNLVMGSQNSYSSAAGIVSGTQNFIAGLYASSISGSNNVVTGRDAVAVSGAGNHATGVDAAILGGSTNTASGSSSSVSGGSLNTASSVTATISGGLRNKASGTQSNVSGGSSNEASGQSSHVGGGNTNKASATNSTVAGGFSNEAQAPASSVSGGDHVTATIALQVLP